MFPHTGVGVATRQEQEMTPALARLILETLSRINRPEMLEWAAEEFALEFPEYPWLDWAHELILARGAVH
jgi:hypothetical protein